MYFWITKGKTSNRSSFVKRSVFSTPLLQNLNELCNTLLTLHNMWCLLKQQLFAASIDEDCYLNRQLFCPRGNWNNIDVSISAGHISRGAVPMVIAFSIREPRRLRFPTALSAAKLFPLCKACLRNTHENYSPIWSRVYSVPQIWNYVVVKRLQFCGGLLGEWPV